MQNIIRDVWADNLEEEMATIRDIVEEFPYIAMVRISVHFSCTALCSVYETSRIIVSFFFVLGAAVAPDASCIFFFWVLIHSTHVRAPELSDISHLIIILWHSKFSLPLCSATVGLISLQDTEFPGVVARPVGSFKSSSDYHYQTLRCNVDLLKIIQLGVTFADAEGNLPQGVCSWQFNFKFSLTYVFFFVLRVCRRMDFHSNRIVSSIS